MPTDSLELVKASHKGQGACSYQFRIFLSLLLLSAFVRDKQYKTHATSPTSSAFWEPPPTQCEHHLYIPPSTDGSTVHTVPLTAEQLYYANPMMFTSNHSHPRSPPRQRSPLKFLPDFTDFAAHDEAAHAALTLNSKARLMRLGRVCCDKSKATSWQCRTGPRRMGTN